MKPEFGQRRENDGEISSTVRGKESGNVLEEDESSWPNKFIGESGELEEEAAARAGESGPVPGDAEVLARESSTEEIDMREVPSIVGQLGVRGGRHRPDRTDIFVNGHTGETCLKHTASPRLGLALEHDPEARALEAEVKAAYSGKQAADREVMHNGHLLGRRDRSPRHGHPTATRREVPALCG